MPRYLRRGVSALRRTYLAITLGSKMEVGTGIEPTSDDYKSTVLPLNYPTVWQADEESNLEQWFWRPPFYHLNYQPIGLPERDSNPRHKD